MGAKALVRRDRRGASASHSGLSELSRPGSFRTGVEGVPSIDIGTSAVARPFIFLLLGEPHRSLSVTSNRRSRNCSWPGKVIEYSSQLLHIVTPTIRPLGKYAGAGTSSTSAAPARRPRRRAHTLLFVDSIARCNGLTFSFATRACLVIRTSSPPLPTTTRTSTLVFVSSS